MAVFDRIVVGINKGVATVGANSKAMIEKAKINTAIEGIEKERVRLVQLLGQKVFDSFNENGEIDMEFVETFSEQINQCLQQTAEQQELLKQVEDELRKVTAAAGGGAVGVAGSVCNCGHANTEGAKFCVKCGSKIG